MSTDTKTLAEALCLANVSLFQDRYENPKARAQDNLEGRTHYVDDGTLSYFKARIISARPAMSNTFFRIMESSSKNYDNTERGYRVVLFDVFGETVYRVDAADMYRTKEQAERAFNEWLGTFDPFAHYRQSLAERIQQLNREADRFKSAAALI